ncbi:hypothetical protein [Acinetobacter pittii]|uniref:hypothetical protein n=1 Tax=Acinetobacter pittii TaxID=48296 RepID=UPI0024DE45BC|nr:hypothetical protein [Acinetobacter pittii]
MPLPNKEQFTGSGVTEHEFKQAQDQLIDYIGNELATSEFVNSKISGVERKIVTFKRGVNIFDKSNVEHGKYYNYLTGEKGDASDEFVAAGLYQIEGNTVYQFPYFYGQQFCIFDKYLNFIAGYKEVGPTHKFTTHADARYIGLTVEVSQLDEFMLCKSSEYPSFYVPFAVINDDLRVTPDQVEDLIPDVKKELGFRFVNLIDTTKVVFDHYVDYLTGNVGPSTGFVAAGPYEIKPNTEYQTSDFYGQQLAFYDERKIFIRGLENVGPTHKFITPANARYIKLTIPNDQLNSMMLAESDLFPESFLPFGSKVIEGLIIDQVSDRQIVTSAEVGATGAVYTGKNAVQLALNSITDATDKKRYVINARGFHKVDRALDVIGYPGYPSMILAKDHVDIIGDGKTVFWCELPYNDDEIGPSADGNTYPRNRYQTLYSYAKDCLIKDVTFVVVNARYALHLDNPLGANATHNFEGVWFYFKGNKGSQQALGIGTSTGEKIYFKGGGSHSDSGQPLYCHNNVKFSDPSLVYFEGHKLSSNESKLIGRIESDGSLLHDKMQFIGCSFGGTAYIFSYGEYRLRANPAQNFDSFDHAEWQLEGYGNDPFLFDNNVNGFCLRIRTTSVGVGKTIRFDKTSSAYPILIKNNQANTDVNLYIDSRDYLDGYIVQDGTVGLPALAFGCKDLGDSAADLEKPTVYTSMGKRLGNCSTSNKTLGVIINGTTYTVTFNKDYTSMSNAAILSEINAALVGATADLYAYGRDYYPMMTDVAETVYNNGATYIPKGSVVTKSQGTVKLANGNDKVFGVALDDIPVMTTTAEGLKKGQGRVLKRGYIFFDRSKAHFVLNNSPTVTDPEDPEFGKQRASVGLRFKLVNGQLIEDSNGIIRIDIDSGVVSINC